MIGCEKKQNNMVYFRYYIFVDWLNHIKNTRSVSRRSEPADRPQREPPRSGFRSSSTSCCPSVAVATARNMTELHQAAAAGDVDGVKELLLQKKCNPNQRDVDWSYKTALHWAAAKGAASIYCLHPTLPI